MKERIYWYPMCRVDGIDQEVIRAMENAGCTRIGYGIDALSDATLGKIKPRQRLSTRLIERTLGITQSSK